MSGKDRPSLSTSSESLLLTVKRKLAWALCTDLLIPPIVPVGALVVDPDDSEDVKRMKLKEHEEKKAQVKQQEIDRESELLNKLDEIVDRVLNSRSEKPADNEEVWAEGGALGGDRMSALAGPVCDLCGNRNSFFFEEDPSSGDTICLGRDGQMSCGKVVHDHRVDEGAEKRNFADDDKDRHQHGPEADPLMPDSENMRINILSNSSDIFSKAFSKELNRTHQRMEENLSSIGNDERKTRTATRSKQKRIAFDLMSTICSSLGIHRSVLNKAQIEFARYRDVREHVHNFNAVVAACMLISYEAILARGGVVFASDDEAAKPKAVFVGDNYVFGNSSVPSSLLKSDDVAVSVLQSSPMGTWNSDDLRTWLTAVLDKRSLDELSGEKREEINVTLVAKVIDKVNSMIMERGPEKLVENGKKRKYPDATPSFFGSTTMSGRNKKFYAGVGAGNRSTTESKLASKKTDTGGHLGGTTKPASEVTSGQAFLRLNLESVIGGNALLGGIGGMKEITPAQMNGVVADIRAAMKTRALYEAAVKEKKISDEKEARRHKAETSSRFVVLNKSNAGELVQPTAVPQWNEKGIDSEADADDMLQEMLSADQSGVNTTVNNNLNNDTQEDNNEEEELNIYDALREEERTRNKKKRFKIKK